jgi:hypothetical protein
LTRETREYYFAAMHDLMHGHVTIPYLFQYIVIMEEIENYEACAGIKLAIEDYENKEN